jgi:Cu+-exporting ATPase
MPVKDLVCSMDVESETAPAKHEYQGKMYYFCDTVCKQMFVLDPEKYIQMAEGKRNDERI